MDHCLQIALATDGASGESLADSLARLGHAVTRVGDGESLLELCWSYCPHLAIGDLRDSGSGLEAAGIVRRELAVPVILISQRWDPAEVEYAEALGITRLVEPFRPLTLVTAIESALRGSERGGLPNLLRRRHEVEAGSGAHAALHL
jgi:DNA-binding response OmpR family regulator